MLIQKQSHKAQAQTKNIENRDYLIQVHWVIPVLLLAFPQPIYSKSFTLTVYNLTVAFFDNFDTITILTVCGFMVNNSEYIVDSWRIL